MRDYIDIANSKKALKNAESRGKVADSMDVRKALMAQCHSGEKTLEEVQAELKKIKRNAKSKGLKTRDQAYRGL